MGSSIRWVCCALLLGSLAVSLGCGKPAGSEKKVLPAQPLPNTTDSK
jgi:hypothetical protein